ncbi:hypothetical protein PUN28_016042 [Cardiocondyla obscurior]|uniref:Uncharacterized protein n=1 Tax=Cardiocondyla obscurior TaxID=286306 RepID=A0AAW2EQP4_9HYME
MKNCKSPSSPQLANCTDWLHRQIAAERPRLPRSYNSAYSRGIYPYVYLYVGYIIFIGR